MSAKFGSLLRRDPRARSRPISLTIIAVVGLALSACSSAEEPATVADETTTTTVAATTESSAAAEPDEAAELFPDVVGVEATSEGDNRWTFAVTLSSPYDSPARYADSWRVMGPDGTVYGERFLTHHHAGEQPFTRTQSGIEIPADVLTVIVEGRDQVSGWGGTTLEYTLPR